MKPIYRYHLSEATGTIHKVEITDYREYHPSPLMPQKTEYRFKLLGQIFCVRDTQFDCLKHWRVYTFNPDYKYAKDLIWNELQAKKDKAYEDYLKYSQIMEKMGLTGGNS